MIDKVEIDLLEVDIPDSGGSPEKGGPSKKERIRGLLKWIAKKKIIVASVAVIFSVIVGVSLIMFSAGEKSHILSDTLVTEVKPTSNKIESLDRFIIDLSDEKGQYRVLVCDITIEMEPNKILSANNPEIRKKAYEALKNKTGNMLKSAISYPAIKKDVKEELDRVLGGGIKEVYFTKFILL